MATHAQQEEVSRKIAELFGSEPVGMAASQNVLVAYVHDQGQAFARLKTLRELQAEGATIRITGESMGGSQTKLIFTGPQAAQNMMTLIASAMHRKKDVGIT